MAARAPSRQALQSLRRIAYPKQPYRCLSCSQRLAQPASQPQSRSQQNESPASSTTHFGFTSIPESEKASRVGSVFTSVAPSYDTMNDLMSLGIHRLWKDQFVRSLNPGVPPTVPATPPQTILDVAGGTGDIALRILDHCTLLNNDTRSRVIISDINPHMLTSGQQRLASTPYAKTARIEFLQADAEQFPTIEDSSIDLYTVAFGIRNFTSIPTALRTAYRVLKPGGVFACLEFGKVGIPLLNGLYKRWSFGVIPLLGQLVAGDRDSYQYLVESIERFPDQRTFQGMIREAGFVVPRVGGLEEVEEGVEAKGWVDLTGGVAAVHKGVKPA